ncbi:head decoration protein [bacterium 210820-DFI.6.37]|nr:head decoration protein [bacterium 210820-DFI.6.37]
MATKLNEKIAEFEKDGLIASAIPQADVFSVSLAATGDVIKRGTVLSKGDDGTMSVMASGGVANCILADDVDATEAVTGVAYRTGHFATQKLIVADGYTLSAEDKEALRDVGILLSDVMEY